jgi:hypothetical protein
MEPSKPSGESRQSSEGASQSRRWLRASATVALVVALLAGFSALALSKNLLPLSKQLSPLSQQVAPGSTAGWQVYHDPLGLFSVRLPPGWTERVYMGSYTEGNRAGSFTGQDEDMRFYDASRGLVSTNLYMWVSQVPPDSGMRWRQPSVAPWRLPRCLRCSSTSRATRTSSLM